MKAVSCIELGFHITIYLPTTISLTSLFCKQREDLLYIGARTKSSAPMYISRKGYFLKGHTLYTMAKFLFVVQPYHHVISCKLNLLHHNR